MEPETATLIAATDDTKVGVLSGNSLLGAALLLVLFITIAGVLLLWYRRGYAFWRPEKTIAGPVEGEVFVRSLLALWLTLGLLVFTLVAFAIEDTTVRATLVGALTASTGAAVAYYFSSKASDDARRDILGAIPGLTGVVDVPDFTKGTLAEAQTWFAAQQNLVSKPQPDSAKPGDKVTGQDPGPNSRVARGSTVTLTAAPAGDPPVVVPVPPAGDPPVVVPVPPAGDPPVVVPVPPAGDPPVVVPEPPAGDPPVVVPEPPAGDPPVVVPEPPAGDPPVVVPEPPAGDPPVVVPEPPAGDPPVVVPEPPAGDPPVVVPEPPAGDPPE